MDIAQYVGLFLIKNEYCFLPGIGSLQVVKKSAKYDADSGSISAPEYTVSFRQGMGAIDDSFANFIASNERISIVHASNYLKDYCQEIKQQLHQGEEAIIPAIGKFKMNENQLIEFETEAHLQIKGKTIPIFRSSPTVEKRKEGKLMDIIENTRIKEPKGDEEIVIKPPVVNWKKIIILGLVVIGVIILIIYLVHISSNFKHSDKQKITTTKVQSQNAIPIQSTSESQSATKSIANDSFMVGIQQYQHLENAILRRNQLNSYGNHTIIWTKDSQTFYIVEKFPISFDKQNAVDSLKRLFNPDGKVEIIGQ